MEKDLLIGKVVGGYKVENVIGRGGMGVVYMATDINLQRVVALKVLAHHLVGEEAFVKRFMREARSIAQLNHPNIVTVYHAGISQGIYAIAMEYVEGKTLAQLYGPSERAAVTSALNITLQSASALAAAHGKGIIHRDINPRNIMVDKTGRVRILDFGLAKLLQGGTLATTIGRALGTPSYMAPEQVHGNEIDQRTDIYALGATLYEILTGYPPYTGETPLGVMRAIAETPFPILTLNNLVPHPVVQLISKMTARNPDFRHPSAEVLRADIALLIKDPITVRSSFVLDEKSIKEIVAGSNDTVREKAKTISVSPIVASAPAPSVPAKKPIPLERVSADKPFEGKQVAPKKKLRPKLFMGIVFLILVLAAVIGVARYAKWPAGAVQNDMEAIQSTLRRWKTGIETLDKELIMSNFSEECYHPDLGGKKEIASFVEIYIGTIVHEKGMFEVQLDDTEIIIKEDNRAVAYPVLFKTINRVLGKMKITLQKEVSGWLIIAVDYEEV